MNAFPRAAVFITDSLQVGDHVVHGIDEALEWETCLDDPDVARASEGMQTLLDIKRERRHYEPRCKVCTSPVKDYMEILRLSGNSLETTCELVEREFGFRTSRESLRNHMNKHALEPGACDLVSVWHVLSVLESQPTAAEAARSDETLQLVRCLQNLK